MRTSICIALVVLVGCHKDRDQQLPGSPPRQTEGARETAQSERVRAVLARERAATADLKDQRAESWIELGEGLFDRRKFAQAANEFSRAADRYTRAFDAWQKGLEHEAYAACVQQLADARTARMRLGLLHIDLSEMAEQAKTSDRPAFQRALVRCRKEVIEHTELATIDTALKAASQHCVARRFEDAGKELNGLKRRLDALADRMAAIEREELGRHN